MRRFPCETTHVPLEEKTFMSAYLVLRSELESSHRSGPQVGRGEAALTPMHRARARTAESHLTDRIRAARATKKAR